MTPPPASRNPFFPLVAGFSALFIITIFATLAAQLGDPAAPLNQLIDAHVGRVMTVEVVGILVTGFLALYVDRRQTLRAQTDGAARAAQQAGSQQPSTDRE